MDGQTVSHYLIRAKIAEGAQGVVYEALHQRLGRRVALKFLHREAMLDPDDRRRFDHEAKVAARLDHSSICPIFDYDEDQGRIFLAMPFLEGSNLRTLLAEGALPLDTAVLIAIQVAEGLQVAHRQDIIHRDIKPSNIMITGADAGRLQAKILDFGLARSRDQTVLTRTGSTVGTAAYMSPEQVLGWPLDGRTDIWSLGAVLYEMVAGQRAFTADSAPAVAYGITHEKPAPVGSLRPEARPELRRIIGRTLERAPGDRYQDVAELLTDLRALRLEMTAPLSPLRSWLWKYRNRLLVTTSVVVVLVIAIAGVLMGLDRLPRQTLALGRPRQITFDDEWEGEPALSPDGTRLAFSRFNGADHDIFWVGLKGGEPVPISVGPADDRNPVWLPDGSGLAFSSERDGRAGVWRSDLSGGDVVQLISDAREPTIAPDGSQFAFTRPDSTGHYRIFVAPLSEPSACRVVSGAVPGTWSHLSPAFSPDGEELCFTDYHDLWLVDPSRGAFRKLTTGGTADSHPTWSPDGRHVYFASRREGTLALWRVQAGGGEPERLTPGSGPENQPSLDPAGHWLAYATDRLAANVLLVDRQGATLPVTAGWSLSQQPALAPDASFVVYAAKRQGGNFCLWRRDLDDGIPVGGETRLTDQSGNCSHPVVSPDGRWIAYYLIDPVTGNRDIWTVPAPGGAPLRVTDDPAPDTMPAWSPDGRRLCFASERAGRAALFVVTIEDGRPAGAPARISTPGLAADYPAWSPDGRRLAFLGSADLAEDAFTIAADGRGQPVRLTAGRDLHQIRWIAETGEIWASGSWGDGGLSVRRLSPDGGGSSPLEPPLRLPPGSDFGWFHPDASGRHVVTYEQRRSGDIWVIESQAGERF